MLWSQRKWGPRWFVPESMRRNPNAYDYYRKMTNQHFKDEESGQVEEMICVICMNAVRFDVDESGSLLNEEPSRPQDNPGLFQMLRGGTNQTEPSTVELSDRTESSE